MGTTLDEAIARARKRAEILISNDKLNKTLGVNSPYYGFDCIKCSEEHEQIAEWLEELKIYKSGEFSKNLQELVYKQGYNKAIDDFTALVEKWCWKHQQYNQDDLNELMDITNQLKSSILSKEAEYQEDAKEVDEYEYD